MLSHLSEKDYILSDILWKVKDKFRLPEDVEVMLPPCCRLFVYEYDG